MMAASAMNNRGIVAPFTNGETDECSFYQMGQRPVTVALYSMAATDTVGTNLIHRGEVAPVVVDPCWVDLYNWVEGEILTCPAPAYIALPFDYWGGTMRYRVSVVASKYHSGRVRMVYEPDPMQDFNATKTLGASVYCFSEVFDVAEGVVVEFDVPWCSIRPWADVRNRIEDIVPEGPDLYGNVGANRACNNGGLYFIVEAPLTSVAPETKSIMIHVESMTGRDFRVARLHAADNEMVFVSAKVGADGVVPRRPLGEGVEYNKPELTFMGESVINARAACKLMCAVGPIVPTPEVDPESNGAVWVRSLFPWLPRTLLRYNDVDRVRQTPVSWFRSSFAAVSGGMRYKISSSTVTEWGPVAGISVPKNPASVAQWVISSYAPSRRARTVTGAFTETSAVYDLTTAKSKIQDAFSGGEGVRIQNLLWSPFELTVPMTCPTTCYYGWDDNPNSGNENTACPPVDVMGLVVNDDLPDIGPLPNLDVLLPILYAGAADDFNMSYYDGPPQMTSVVY